MAANLTTKLGQLVDVLTPDTTNTRIGVANSTPARTLDVTGTFGASGASTLGGALTYGGVTLSNAVTGTGNMVLSASPTLTGTLTFPSPFTLGSTSVTTTGTQINYLNAATGTTGTTSTNLVFSGSPTFTGTVAGASLLFTTSIRAPTVAVDGGAYLYASGSDTMAFYASSAERMRLTSTGLGIGTTSISYALVVAGTSSLDNITMRSNTSAPTADAFIYRPADNTLAFGTGSTERMRLTSTGNTLLGTTGNYGRLTVAGTTSGQPGITVITDDGNYLPSITQYKWTGTGSSYYGTRIYTSSAGGSSGTFYFQNAPSNSIGSHSWTTRMILDDGGRLGLGMTPNSANPIDITVSSSSYPGICLYNSYNGTGGNAQLVFRNYNSGSSTGYGAYLSLGNDNSLSLVNQFGNPIVFGTNNTEVARIDSSGRLIVGTITPEGFVTFVKSSPTSGNGLVVSNGVDANVVTKIGSSISGIGAGTNTPFYFCINSSEVARFDTNGRLQVGTTAGTGRVNMANAGGGLHQINSTGGDQEILNLFSDNNLYFSAPSNIIIRPGGGGEAARFDTSGCLIVNATSTTNRDTTAAVYLGPSVIQSNRTSGATGDFGRLSTDGDIVVFRKDGTVQGSISVSGSTISYNAFAGSHWSQLEDGGRAEILRGTVMEAMDELCVWPDEENERLPKCKISDTAGSKNVYGVFMAWDNDWTVTNDLHVMAVGSFICRIASNSVVQIGDLLESNGDGTARVQADDVIRSSTLGKVVSAEQVYKYDDGSYCVPAVLYCG